MVRTATRRDRGMSESVQWTMLTPLILMLVLGIIQVGLWGYARGVVLNAAVAAAEEASLYGAPAGSGVAIADAVAVKGGLAAVEVTVEDDGTRVTAVVRGHMPSLIDLGLTRVDAQVTRPKEKVTQP